jgi:hypothetical protein
MRVDLIRVSVGVFAQILMGVCEYMSIKTSSCSTKSIQTKISNCRIRAKGISIEAGEHSLNLISFAKR